MAIFNSYVSLPEGTTPKSPSPKSLDRLTLHGGTPPTTHPQPVCEAAETCSTMVGKVFICFKEKRPEKINFKPETGGWVPGKRWDNHADILLQVKFPLKNDGVSPSKYEVWDVHLPAGLRVCYGKRHLFFSWGMLKLLSAIRYCDISIKIQLWKHGVEKRKKGIQPITVENPPDIVCFPVVLWVKSPNVGQWSK